MLWFYPYMSSSLFNGHHSSSFHDIISQINHLVATLTCNVVVITDHRFHAYLEIWICGSASCAALKTLTFRSKRPMHRASWTVVCRKSPQIDAFFFFVNLATKTKMKRCFFLAHTSQCLWMRWRSEQVNSFIHVKLGQRESANPPCTIANEWHRSGCMLTAMGLNAWFGQVSMLVCCIQTVTVLVRVKAKSCLLSV